MPVIGREDRHEVALDLVLVVLGRQTEAVGEPEHVRVHGNPLDLAERLAEHDVRGLASYAGQRREALHGVGHLSVELGDDDLAGPDDVLGLLVVEAQRTNVLLDFELVGLGEVSGCRKALEQRRCRLVHPNVGGLRREDHGDQQLVGVGEVQRGVRVAVVRLEPLGVDGRERFSLGGCELRDGLLGGAGHVSVLSDTGAGWR